VKRKSDISRPDPLKFIIKEWIDSGRIKGKDLNKK